MACYLDHNATTPLDERVLEAMLPYLKNDYGNPSSVHLFGRRARSALDRAREQVASLLNAHPSQVIFTSGGTEANNYALKGMFPDHSGRLLIGAGEHASIREPAAALARRGVELQSLGVDAEGRYRLDELDKLLKQKPSLVSLMWANNETGTVQPMAAIAERCAAAGVPLHSDAVQAAGKLAVDFSASGIQMMSLSAHKFYGPKGIGALLVDKSVKLEPLLHGGGQERNQRGGTENLAAIVGFGHAAELAQQEGGARHEQSMALRQRLEQALTTALPQVEIFAADAGRLPNTVMFALPGIESQTLILALDGEGFALSSGSACGSHHDEPSAALKAMGVSAELARCALRVSLGRENTAPQVDDFVAALARQVNGLQRLASVGW